MSIGAYVQQILAKFSIGIWYVNLLLVLVLWSLPFLLNRILITKFVLGKFSFYFEIYYEKLQTYTKLERTAYEILCIYHLSLRIDSLAGPKLITRNLSNFLMFFFYAETWRFMPAHDTFDQLRRSIIMNAFWCHLDRLCYGSVLEYLENKISSQRIKH